MLDELEVLNFFMTLKKANVERNEKGPEFVRNLFLKENGGS